MLRGSLRKAFGGFDVLCLGLGILIGSGWAQFTGTAGVYAGWGCGCARRAQLLAAGAWPALARPPATLASPLRTLKTRHASLGLLLLAAAVRRSSSA